MSQDFDRIAAKLRKLADVSDDARMMGEIGATVVNGISDRSEKGVLPSGELMPQYTKQYKRLREKKGRRTDVVNLQFTGKMLGAMAWSISGNKVTVKFNNLADNDKAAGISKKRAFFKQSEKDMQAINGIVQAYAAKAMK